MASYHLRIKDDTRSGGKRVSAKKHVDYILREDGKFHADYINREGAQSDHNDCVFKENQLPKWAKGSAQKFFSAATRYEDKGNVRYREIELSLPNELTLEQNREIVDRFIADHLSNHYYAYAIHEKTGELSGERHPHVHIMFSERLIDDVEKMGERPAYKYFRRAAKPLKGERVASFERRRQHGAPKDKKWHNKKYLYEIRADFARIQNEVLAKNGFSIRVDHRSLKAQKEEAEQNGDDFTANLYKRIPESYIGVISAHEDDELSNGVKRYRQIIQNKQHSLFQDYMRKKTAQEEETKFLVNQAERAWFFLSNSPAYKSANLEDETLGDLNRGILSSLARIQQLKRKLVGFLGARERVRKEYLPATDYQFICDYECKLKQRDELERISKELISSTGKYDEDIQAFQTIMRGIEKKISDLRSSLAQNNPQYWAILGKLDEPYRRKNVELVMHGILQNDLDVLRDLKKTSTAVLKNIDALRARIQVKEMPKTVFTAREVRDNLLLQYRSLKKQRQEAIDTCYSLMLKRIFPSEAMNLAKNFFVHDGFKKLQIEQEEYEKALAKYERDFAENCKREIFFNSTNWTNHGVKLQEQYYITKEKINLEETGRRLSHSKIRLENELTRLETLCQTKEAQEKIALLAADILRKNLKIVLEYEEAKKRIGDLYDKLQEAKKRFYAFDDGYKQLKQNRVYRVIQPVSNSTKTSALKENELVAIIADALLGEPYAVQLVARFDGNNLEMEKDWEMMLESDKDEIIRRKMVREL